MRGVTEFRISFLELQGFVIRFGGWKFGGGTGVGRLGVLRYDPGFLDVWLLIRV